MSLRKMILRCIRVHKCKERAPVAGGDRWSPPDFRCVTKMLSHMESANNSEARQNTCWNTRHVY